MSADIITFPCSIVVPDSEHGREAALVRVGEMEADFVALEAKYADLRLMAYPPSKDDC